jgi:hypothetical protein
MRAKRTLDPMPLPEAKRKKGLQASARGENASMFTGSNAATMHRRRGSIVEDGLPTGSNTVAAEGTNGGRNAGTVESRKGGGNGGTVEGKKGGNNPGALEGKEGASNGGSLEGKKGGSDAGTVHCKNWTTLEGRRDTSSKQARVEGKGVNADGVTTPEPLPAVKQQPPEECASACSKALKMDDGVGVVGGSMPGSALGFLSGDGCTLGSGDGKDAQGYLGRVKIEETLAGDGNHPEVEGHAKTPDSIKLETPGAVKVVSVPATRSADPFPVWPHPTSQICQVRRPTPTWLPKLNSVYM